VPFGVLPGVRLELGAALVASSFSIDLPLLPLLEELPALLSELPALLSPRRAPAFGPFPRFPCTTGGGFFTTFPALSSAGALALPRESASGFSPGSASAVAPSWLYERAARPLNTKGKNLRMHVSFSRGAPRKNEACRKAARRMPKREKEAGRLAAA